MSRSRRGDTDLFGVSALALAGAALLAISSPPDWLQAVILSPLVLALPGYAVSAALFPPGTLPGGDRAIQTFVFSVSTTALGSLILQLAFDMHQAAWIALTVVVTLLGSLIALRRRHSSRLQNPRRQDEAGWGRLRPPVLAIVLLLVAAGGGGLAVSIAAQGVYDQEARQSFASLWAAPAEPGGSLDGPLDVGVWNHGGPSEYRLEVERGGELRGNFKISLDSSGTWSRRLNPRLIKGRGPLLINLFAGVIKYRSVELDIGAGE